MMNEVIRTVLAHKGNEVHTVEPTATVFDAVGRMNKRRVGALLVVDDGRPIGIFTERDVLVRVIAQRLDPTVTPVDEVMTHALVTVSADATVADAMMLVTDKRCRHLPVIDDDRVCGLISIGDLTGWLVRDQQLTIDDLHDYVRRA